MIRVLVAVAKLAALSAHPVHSYEWQHWRRAFNDFAPRLFK